MQRLKIMILFTLWCILHFSQSSATEYQPWLGNIYEFEVRSSLRCQDYSRLSSGSHLKKHMARDFFLNVSLSGTLTDLGLELEVIEARTRRQSGDIDHLKATGRYLWQDDVAGDPISLITGLSLGHAFHYSLRDMSSFHHGRAEAELFVSIGKEVAQETLWGSRWWGLLGIGSAAERGSPWLRFNLTYEKCLSDKQEIQIFLHSLWGLGHKKLRLHHFHGYGPIQHQSIDLGLRYTYLLEYFGSASLEYSYRVHAYNFPLYTHQVWAQLLYTFGL